MDLFCGQQHPSLLLLKAWSDKFLSLLNAGRNGRRQEKPTLSFHVIFLPVLSQAESWQRLYNDTRSLFPVVLEQLEDYNAKLSDLQESLHQALDHIRDAEDMNRATAAKQRDYEVQWTTLTGNTFQEQHKCMPNV